MEKLRLTAKEFMNITGQPKSTVYNWIALGKLETEDTIKGKKIVITQDELDALKVLENLGQVLEVSKTNPEPVQNSPKTPENSNLLEILEIIAPYIEKASKLDQIEDKSKEDKENTKFWQAKYFEAQNEIKELIKINTELKVKLESCEKKSGFLGLFKK
jgi:hypothetical protein